jgi:hypothetical protein
MPSNPPANPAEAMRQLTRFARQLREYVKETVDEVTPYIEHSLAEYVAENIERVRREHVTMDEALGLAWAKIGAPLKKDRASDPEGHKKQQLLIFNAMRLRSQQPPVKWAAIPHTIGYSGSWRQLQKLCREKADPIAQAAHELAHRASKQKPRSRVSL